MSEKRAHLFIIYPYPITLHKGCYKLYQYVKFFVFPGTKFVYIILFYGFGKLSLTPIAWDNYQGASKSFCSNFFPL